ncbi:MAG: nucleoside triphosphate pyrophosphohydrolase [Gemmatimonadota bacterium]
MSSEQQIPQSAGGPAPHPDAARPQDESLGRALALVRFLRSACEWDAAQTPASLRPYLIEEAQEVAQAILRGSDDDLRDELGDLLLNVAFQLVLAEERDAFTSNDVVASLEAKMRRRHPHLYGDASSNPGWEKLKAAERTEQDPFDGMPDALEPLNRALRLQDRAAALRFDWPDHSGPASKLREELLELEEAVRGDESGSEVEEELGDILFTAVNLARLLGVHPAVALDAASDKFARRFKHLVRRANEQGLDMECAELEELEAIWLAVKRTEA